MESESAIFYRRQTPLPVLTMVYINGPVLVQRIENVPDQTINTNGNTDYRFAGQKSHAAWSELQNHEYAHAQRENGA